MKKSNFSMKSIALLQLILVIGIPLGTLTDCMARGIV
jgi:hypothetical protein